MAREVLHIDFNSFNERRDFIFRANEKRGRWKVTFDEDGDFRTLSQNDWYYACIVPAFALGADREWGEKLSEQRAHEELAGHFLAETKERLNKRTGEIERYVSVRSTAKLTRRQMAEYCDDCRNLIADYFGIVVPDPDPALKRRWR